jgi:2-oxoglutarate dehydrogenase E1 component
LLADALAQYPGATEIIWVQEEPRNMGAWPFLHERLQSLVKDGQKLQYVGRPVAAAPATGSHHRHEDQQKALVSRALGI